MTDCSWLSFIFLERFTVVDFFISVPYLIQESSEVKKQTNKQWADLSISFFSFLFSFFLPDKIRSSFTCDPSTRTEKNNVRKTGDWVQYWVGIIP